MKVVSAASTLPAARVSDQEPLAAAVTVVNTVLVVPTRAVTSMVARPVAPVPVSVPAATLVMPSLVLTPLSVKALSEAACNCEGADAAIPAAQVTAVLACARLVLPAASMYCRVSVAEPAVLVGKVKLKVPSAKAVATARTVLPSSKLTRAPASAPWPERTWLVCTLSLATKPTKLKVEVANVSSVKLRVCVSLTLPALSVWRVCTV